jgi:hypothetical protein
VPVNGGVTTTGDVILTVGVADGVYVTVRTAFAVCPRLSVAVIVITFVPMLSAMLSALQEVVPVHVPLPPWLLVHDTPVRLYPDPGDADPAMDKVFADVE